MQAKLSAFVIWAFVAGTAVFWGLRLFVQAPQAPTYAVPAGDAAGALRGDLSRLLGAPPAKVETAEAAPELAARFRLVGVMAPRAGSAVQRSGDGYALIMVDGKPARPFSVGARIDEGLVLQAVSLRTAALGPAQGQASVTLELPQPTPAATGTLPPASMEGDPDVDAVEPSVQPQPQPRPVQMRLSRPPGMPPLPPREGVQNGQQ